MRFPTLDGLSFWLGFFFAWLLVALLYRSRHALAQVRDELYRSLRGLRERLTAGTESNWRADLYRYAQTAHLAGALFPLDDILITPRFWPPPPHLDPATPPPDEDLNTVIPHLPEWPELAGAYHAPTVRLETVLAGDAPVVILGGPGAGKSTLLAHLAARATQGDPALFPHDPTPIFVHAADLELPLKPRADVLQPLVAAAQLRASALTAATLARHLRLRLREFTCVIFLDGFDELPARQTELVLEWLAAFRRQHPEPRIIAAAGLAGYGGLTGQGFAPVYLAPWSADDQAALLQKWSAAWAQARTRARLKAEAVDAQLVLGWLSLGNRGRTPLELTLKTWAGLAGDPRGMRPAEWLEAYILRHGVKPAGQRALGKLGLAVLTNPEAAGLTRAQAREACLPFFQPATPNPNAQPEIDVNAFLDDLLAQRLLVKQGADRLAFRHPLILAYCAATALAADPEAAAAAIPAAAPPPLWTWTLYFLAALGDLTPVLKRLFSQPPDVLQTEVLIGARWLRDAPAAAPWRNELFRRLSKLLLDGALPEGLRVRALAAFTVAGDFSVTALFRQALAHADPFTRRLAALGLGLLGDGTAVPPLVALFADPYLDVRWAAALALAAIGTDPALAALRQGLTQGDDAVRQACAQALARNTEFGHAGRKETLAHPDLSTRRAAVLGLAEIGAEWVPPLIEDLQRREQEWYVRNAAQDILGRLKEPPVQTPEPYAAPENQGWLVAWAAARGLGVPPGRAAVEVLNHALREGDEHARLAAAEAWRGWANPAPPARSTAPCAIPTFL